MTKSICYAAHFARAGGKGWIMTGLDADGFDIANGDEVRRVFFDTPLQALSELRITLVEMAKIARAASESA